MTPSASQLIAGMEAAAEQFRKDEKEIAALRAEVAALKDELARRDYTISKQAERIAHFEIIADS